MDMMGDIMKPQFYEENGKRFAKFFLINPELNKRNWRVEPHTIQTSLASFLGKPYISEPNFEHFGAENNMPVSEILEKQEAFRKGTIIATPYDPKTQTAFAVVEIHDDATWQDLNKGEAIFVSPGITGFPSTGKQGEDVYWSEWYGLHLARVKTPAFNVMVASLKKTCEGPEGLCIQRLISTASALAKLTSSSLNSSEHNTDQQMEREQELLKEVAELKVKVSSLEKDNADLTQKVKTASDQEKELNTYKSKVASFETEKIKELATRIANTKLDAEIITPELLNTEIDALSKLSIDALTSKEADLKPLAEKISEYKKSTHGVGSTGRQTTEKKVIMPVAVGSAGKNSKPTSLNEIPQELLA